MDLTDKITNISIAVLLLTSIFLVALVGWDLTHGG